MEAPKAGQGADGDAPLAPIERFFFARRDLVADGDRIVAQHGLGRRHRRVLHVVARRPGLAGADRLDFLRVAKRSFNEGVRPAAGAVTMGA